MSEHHHDCGGHCSHAHGGGPSTADRGAEFSLYKKINIDRVECLNEAREGSGKCVFKAWENRLDRTEFVESDADQELLFKIPFTGNVKLKGVIVIGGEETYHPKSMKLFKNRTLLSLDNANDLEPDEKIDLHHDIDGTVDYSVNIAKFNSVNELAIFFPTNFGAETTKVYYIGLKGDFQEVRRKEAPIVTYEARANPADHKTKAFDVPWVIH